MVAYFLVAMTNSLVAVLKFCLSSMSVMLSGNEFQSIKVRGINEYLKQFLFVWIWVNLVWRVDRVTGRKIFGSGMAKRPRSDS